MSRLRVAVCGAALCALAAGCTSSPTFTMTSGAGSTLRTDVLALTQAIAAHDWATADTALAQLRADLATSTAAGGVSVARAEALRADVARIAADLAAHRAAVAPPSSSTSSQPKPKPEPKPKPKPEPKPSKDHGHGHGHGEGGD